MTLKDIIDKVENLRQAHGDDEIAHGMEDELHVAFIEFVAGSVDPELAKMARAVLETREIDFARWCA